MQIEKSAEVETLVPEITFQFDPRGEWCLTIGRQRLLKESESKTESCVGFIKGLHHVIEGTTKEFYRIITLKNSWR